MTVWRFAQTIGPLLCGLYFIWLIWRSLRTGMPFGNPNMNPRRDERPGQFWSLIAFYAAVAIFYLADASEHVAAAF
jgi:hypothetical protein